MEKDEVILYWDYVPGIGWVSLDHPLHGDYKERK